MAGLGRLVIYRRERLVLLEPFGPGMLATLLRYQDEVRSPKPYFEEVGEFEAPDAMRKLAAQLIEQNTAPFQPETFEDRYEQALVALVRSKRSGKAADVPPSAPQASNVVDLMEALKRSIAVEKGEPPAKAVAPGAKTAARAGEKKPSDGKRKAPKPAPARKGRPRNDNFRKAS